MFNNKQGAAMFNEQWKQIAEAALQLKVFAACDEALSIALDRGINLRADTSPVYPTVLVGGKPLAIMITPRLFPPSPEITVTVLGNICHVKDYLESRGYRYSEMGWCKQFKLEKDGDEALIRAVFSAVEEALLLLRALVQLSLSEIEKACLVLEKWKAETNVPQRRAQQ